MRDVPNVVLITCHDLGQHLACYGVPTVRSPNLDALAGQGVRLSNSWCVAPQCSPSRAAIATGRYPHSNGVMGLAHGHFGWDLHPGERHIAQLLRERDWSTFLFGLQHESINTGRLGFDRIVPQNHPPECTRIAASVAQFLEEEGKRSEPFYLQVGLFEPHRPFDIFDTPPDDELGITVPPYLVDEPSAREEFASFQGAVRKVDGAIGVIVDALERTGLREPTLLVATTDHGIPFPRAKCSLYDPGLEVSSIWSWPGGGWPSATVLEEPIANIDYLPTILEAAGVDRPPNLQGRSFAPLLRGGAYERRTEIFAEMTYHGYYDPRRCIRTDSHKLIVNFSTAPFFMDPSQTWRPATVTREPPDPSYAFHPPIELYDLRSDPLEERNLADEGSASSVREDLLHRLAEWMRQTSDPIIHGVPPSPAHRRSLEALGLDAGIGSDPRGVA